MILLIGCDNSSLVIEKLFDEAREEIRLSYAFISTLLSGMSSRQGICSAPCWDNLLGIGENPGSHSPGYSKAKNGYWG